MTDRRYWQASAVAIALALAAHAALAVDVAAYPEFARPSPTGGVIKADCTSDQAGRPLVPAVDGSIVLKAARNGYVSLHLAVSDVKGGSFSIKPGPLPAGVELDLFREWFHRLEKPGERIPDALIPVPAAGGTFPLPDPQMQLPGQTTAAFWLDLFVARDARVGRVPVTIGVQADGRSVQFKLALDVLEAIIPDDDALTADHNGYGLSFVNRYFAPRRRAAEKAGRTFENSDEFWRSLHEYYRVFREHRGSVHVQGGNHVGTVTPAYVPEIAGDGRERRVTSWELFDKHYGPLLDGSAFAGGRRPVRPVEGIYLHINMEWPASYVNWGRPGYDVEFVNVVSEMERHFREKGWTRTWLELFLRHKKRFHAFEYDGDEPRFSADNFMFREFDRLLKKAVPAGSPVKFVQRADVSWLMRQQFDDLKGVIGFWVCGSGIAAFYPEAPAMLKARGDRVWFYTGTPKIDAPLRDVFEAPLRAWMWGVQGFERWSTTGPGADPFLKSDGGEYCLLYPGEQFGIDGPLTSIRLKVQRNIMQDLALLERQPAADGEALRAEVASLAGAKPIDWWNPHPPITTQPVLEWNNASLNAASGETIVKRKNLDGPWWERVRVMARRGAEEPRK